MPLGMPFAGEGGIQGSMRRYLSDFCAISCYILGTRLLSQLQGCATPYPPQVDPFLGLSWLSGSDGEMSPSQNFLHAWICSSQPT